MKKEELEDVKLEMFNTKQMDAIWSVYIRNRDCRSLYSNSSLEYDLDLDTKASVIIAIIEDYFKK